MIRGGPRIASFEPSEVKQVTAMTLSPMIGMDGDLVDEGTGRPLGADQDADRVEPEKATMQLLHQT